MSQLSVCFHSVLLFRECSLTKENQLHYLACFSTFSYTCIHISVYTCSHNISQRQELSTIQRQLNNPVYDTNMEPHDAYSSSGPTYEQVANGNEQDHTCSILERNKITTDRHSNQLIAIDEEQSYHVVGREGVEGAGCDGVYSEASNYEVPMSSKTDSKVWLCEEEYSTLKH